MSAKSREIRWFQEMVFLWLVLFLGGDPACIYLSPVIRYTEEGEYLSDHLHISGISEQEQQLLPILVFYSYATWTQHKLWFQKSLNLC